MKNNIIILSFFLLLLAVSCEQERPEPPEFSSRIEISIEEASEIRALSAILHGAIGETFGTEITQYGHCWDTIQNPDLDGPHTSFGPSDNPVTFSSDALPLKRDKMYEARTYFKTGELVVYSNPVAFTTRDGLAELSTSPVSLTYTTSAASGGEIIEDWDFPVSARGVVWSSAPGPTIEKHEGMTSDGAGTASFTSSLEGLATRSTYYVRAYATNEVGTAYGEELSFYTGCRDIDGNEYETVTLGNRLWMAENLKTTRFADGSPIPHVESAGAWNDLSAYDKAYCWYGHSETNRDIYGGLYTWAAAMNGAATSATNPSGVQGVCPSGWHLPSDAEWKGMEMYLGMSRPEANDINWRGTDEGGKLKEAGTAHWDSPNTAATNSSGFTALPGGKISTYGLFDDLHSDTKFWTATQYSGLLAWSRMLSYGHADVNRTYDYKEDGFSVRCVSD